MPFPFPTTVAPLSEISGNAIFWLSVNGAVNDDLYSFITTFPFVSNPIASTLVLTPEGVLTVICSTALLFWELNLANSCCSKALPFTLFCANTSALLPLLTLTHQC